MTFRSKSVGHVYVFGSGDCCQLGLGEDVLSRKRPTKIDYFDDKEIIDIAAGGLHNLALSKNGAVYSWGCNDEKALGHECPEWTIGKVELLSTEKICQIACGDSISAALTENGHVYAWGTFRDSKGVIGFSPTSSLQSTPVKIQSLLPHKIIALAAGSNHLIVLSDQGQLFAWGSGEQGQLGHRIIERRKAMNALEPRNITPRSRSRIMIAGIACGSYHSMTWSSQNIKNSIFTWGLNNYGQLGHGDHIDRILPEGLSQNIGDIKSMNGGEHHTIALTSQGQVWSWGRGDSGQLGYISIDTLNPPEHCDEPVEIKGFTHSIQMIASGSNHCLAVDSQNQLYSWGFGGMYQLGNGKEDDELVPFKVDFKAGKILAVEAGGQHSMLLCQHP